MRCFDLAAPRLTANDEPGAEKALGGSGLTQFSPDGVTLMRALAKAGEMNQSIRPYPKVLRATGWYMTRNPDYEFLSPRDYLKGKSWEERRQVGLDALTRAGVLKP